VIFINTKVITFWSPIKRQGCSTNTALYASYLSKVMNLSDLIVVCLPQDRFVYEKLDLSSFENKKNIFLSSMHN